MTESERIAAQIEKENARLSAVKAKKAEKSARRRSFWKYVADNWIAFVAMLIALIAFIRTL